MRTGQEEFGIGEVLDGFETHDDVVTILPAFLFQIDRSVTAKRFFIKAIDASCDASQ